MVRVITQDTYDEVVKENIDEFEMTPEEAIKEAVAQFEAQGVDLSNIIKDLALSSGEDHLVTTTVNALRKLCAEEKQNDQEVLKQLDVLKTECSKDIARRIRAGKDGAYTLLIGLLEHRLKNKLDDKDTEFIVAVLSTLQALMDGQPDLLDDKGVDIVKRILDEIKNESVLIETLNWTTVCCVKHEMNRQKLFGKNIGNNLKILLNSKNPKLLAGALAVVRKLTLDDDVRVQFGKAHEHARELGLQLLEPLTGLMKEHTGPPLVSELMLTTASLLVRHELCKTVADAGVEWLFTVLADNYDSAPVTQQANKLITALAGHDDVKRDLVRSGIVPIIISLLNRHASNASSAASTLKCVAALSLREPEHGRLFLEAGAPEPVLHCMKIHPQNTSVQKNACWAMRNMVSRCREYNSKFHELDAQQLLDAAYRRFGNEFGFDIKSALRDLECDVKLDEQWTGQGVQTHN